MPRKRIPHEVDTATIEENAQSSEMATFAKTFNALLVEKNVHQDDMAQALGISTGSISAWRNGKKEPRLSMIIKIANYLNVDCHYLMTGIRAENYICSNELGLSELAVSWMREQGTWGIANEVSAVIDALIYDCCYRTKGEHIAPLVYLMNWYLKYDEKLDEGGRVNTSGEIIKTQDKTGYLPNFLNLDSQLIESAALVEIQKSLISLKKRLSGGGM